MTKQNNKFSPHTANCDLYQTVLQQGSLTPVLEGQCPDEFSSNPNQNIPEQANQGV